MKIRLSSCCALWLASTLHSYHEVSVSERGGASPKSYARLALTWQVLFFCVFFVRMPVTVFIVVLIHFTNVLIHVKGHGAGVSGQTFHDREKGRKTLAAAGSKKWLAKICKKIKTKSSMTKKQ